MSDLKINKLDFSSDIFSALISSMKDGTTVQVANNTIKNSILNINPNINVVVGI